MIIIIFLPITQTRTAIYCTFLRANVYITWLMFPRFPDSFYRLAPPPAILEDAVVWCGVVSGVMA